MLPSLLRILPLLALASALDNTSLRPRSVYQLLTDRFARTDLSTTAPCPSRAYCGGTWLGIAQKLDYIQGMGFDTIWISPIVQNIEGYTHWGEAYHGYWTQDPTQLNAHFGTAADLLALSTALHSRGMYLMVDVVVNHVATTQDYKTFKPDGSYGPFDEPDDFHEPFCFVDYANQTSMEVCSVGDGNVPLPDINTEKPAVVDFWNRWIKDTVGTYAIDAIRIDTVRHVRQSFWDGFTASAGVVNIGEIFSPDAGYVAGYQSHGINPLNYPTWYSLLHAFNSTRGDLNALRDSVVENQGKWDTGLGGVFVNNHDNPRFEGMTQDQALRRNVHAWPMVGDGVPIVYYGSEAGFTGGQDPDNREAFWPTAYSSDLPLYSFFRNLNRVRRAAGEADPDFYTSKMSVTTLGSNELLVRKGPLVSLLSNRGGSSTSPSMVLASSLTGWQANTDILDAISCQVFKTDRDGTLRIAIEAGEPRVLIEDRIRGDACM